MAHSTKATKATKVPVRDPIGEEDAESQRKHGASFGRAQYAFADPKRVIAKDVSNS